VVSFLKASGVRGIAQRSDWPKYTEEEPEVYKREDLDKFFAARDDEERMWFEFFLMTGMREQEVMHATWSDVNLARAVVAVRYKPELRLLSEDLQGPRDPHTQQAGAVAQEMESQD